MLIWEECGEDRFGEREQHASSYNCTEFISCWLGLMLSKRRAIVKAEDGLLSRRIGNHSFASQMPQQATRCNSLTEQPA